MRIVVLLATCALMLVNVSCTRHVRLSDEQIREFQSDDDIGYKIVTAEGTTYLASRYDVAGENLVILELIPQPVFEPERETPPITIPLSRIAYVERLEDRGHLNKIGGVTLIVIAGAFVLLALMFIGSGPITLGN